MNSKKTTITVSEIVKQKIMDELVEPCFYKDIKALMSERTIWRKSGNVFETLSKLFVGAASILSFATGLNFWSGTSSVLSLGQSLIGSKPTEPEKKDDITEAHDSTSKKIQEQQDEELSFEKL